MERVLAGLAPERVWHYFEEISAIPRGSGNEKGIADYLEAFGKARGYETYHDAIHNVLIRKPASAGCEGAPALLLQGHTDIVCEKNADVVHDFRTDPIKLVVEDGWITADGTTLGADNGMAVAYMLAALEDDALRHPVLECLFTAQEEVGLDGAKAFDGSLITARRMVNMDCGGEGVITVSCAGGMRVDLSRKMSMLPFSGQALRIFVTGLAGGHSGGQIDKYLGNSNRIMGRVLAALSDVCVASIEGGSKDNAIPRECEAVVAVPCIDCAKKEIARMEQIIRAELGEADREFAIVAEPVQAPQRMASPEDTRRLWQLLCLAFNGVQAMSHSIEGLVDASCNMGVIHMEGDTVTVSFSPRASMESLNDESQMRLEILAEVMGFSFDCRSRYPGWSFVKDSPLRDLLCRIYREQTGKEMELKAVHGGLECGILLSKVPGLDIVAIGPDAEGAHSPDERVNIASAERTWNFVRAIIEHCAE